MLKRRAGWPNTSSLLGPSIVSESECRSSRANLGWLNKGFLARGSKSFSKRVVSLSSLFGSDRDGIVNRMILST